MEFNYRSVAKKSDLSGERFEEGQKVVSFLYLAKNNTVERFDILDAEEDKYEVPGKVICRWVHSVKAKGDEDSSGDAASSMEEVFLSLYDERQTDEDEDLVARTSDALKFFLSLQLERKRILRRSGGGKFYHIRLKKEFEVPDVEISPELLKVLATQLEVLSVP